MYPREAIDFERHPMPRASMARIRDRLANRETRSSAVEQRIFNPTVAGSIPAGSPNTMPALPATTE